MEEVNKRKTNKQQMQIKNKRKEQKCELAQPEARKRIGCSWKVVS